MSYAVRSNRIHSPAFLRELHQAVWSVNPNLAIGYVQTLNETDAVDRPTSFALTMLVIAAAVALLLGVVGLYGVIAYIAAQRSARSASAWRSARRLAMFEDAPGHGLSLTPRASPRHRRGARARRVMRALLFGLARGIR